MLPRLDMPWTFGRMEPHPFDTLQGPVAGPELAAGAGDLLLEIGREALPGPEATAGLGDPLLAFDREDFTGTEVAAGSVLSSGVGDAFFDRVARDVSGLEFAAGTGGTRFFDFDFGSALSFRSADLLLARVALGFTPPWDFDAVLVVGLLGFAVSAFNSSPFGLFAVRLRPTPLGGSGTGLSCRTRDCCSLLRPRSLRLSAFVP